MATKIWDRPLLHKKLHLRFKQNFEYIFKVFLCTSGRYPTYAQVADGGTASDMEGSCEYIE